ncbi:S41 family peptidase [Candidatus Roizmanbacteria bacterium]|nr:S41 family peptidase [Candidatus Roizmanbacteria bacterium]
MFKKKATNIILLLSVVVFLFGSGFKLGQYKSRIGYIQQLNKSVFSRPNSTSSIGKNLDFTLFWETWEELEKKFIDKNKIDPQKMYYGAIKGMASSLEDPYTFFLTPEENKESKDDLAGKFEGIGAQLGLQDNRIVIVAPLKNSPAKRAGINAGDFINKVDDRSTKGWTLPQAVSKIRGPKGTKVKLTLERDSKELDLEIVREQIRVESVELNYEKKKNQTVAYIKLNQFGDNTNDEWDRAIAEVALRWQNREIKGLIIDVRDNPGGYLDSSVYLASEFLPLGKMVVKQTSTTQESKSYEVEREGRLLEIPLLVIINKGSASASEILAGALRDYKRAILVGEKSFGKGSVQEATNLKDGAGIHITVAKWILPKGDWINSKGIEPDIKVENKTKEGSSLTREADLQLEKAIEQLIK